MNKIICPVCNEEIEIGDVRHEWDGEKLVGCNVIQDAKIAYATDRKYTRALGELWRSGAYKSMPDFQTVKKYLIVKSRHNGNVEAGLSEFLKI